MEFRNKKVLVCGIARSGVSAANLLADKGAVVTLTDNKTKDKLIEIIKQIKDTNIRIIAGENPDSIVEIQHLLVLSPGVPTNLSYIQKARDLNIPVIGEFELGAMFCKAPIAAITGTNGKTTTTSMLYEIVKEYNPLCEVVGNIGIAFTEKAEEIPENGYCVAEVSSFQLETINSFHPKVAAVLNVTPDHLDRHGSVENYVYIKERIFLNQTKDDYLIINYDDEICRSMAEHAKAKILYFSRENIQMEGVYLLDNVFWLQVNGNKIKLISTNQLKIIGSHNHENAMAAMLMAYCMGVPVDIIKTKAMAFTAVAHRIEYVAEIKGVVYYNDSKGTNPESAIKAIESMSRPTILIGGGYNKGSDFSQWVRYFKGNVKKIIVIGDVADVIIETCEREGYYNYEKIQTFEEAVRKASEYAQEGDAVLLSPACASWGMFDDYEQRGNIFKEIVHKIEEGA